MKRKTTIILAAIALSLSLFVFSGWTAEKDSSIKAISKPYIAQYECVTARLGETDLLKNFDYIKIILEDAQKFELVFKPKDGEKQTAEGSYSVDPKTRKLTGEIGILGYKYKESVTVKNGRFTISKIIGAKEFVAEFKAV